VICNTAGQLIASQFTPEGETSEMPQSIESQVRSRYFSLHITLSARAFTHPSLLSQVRLLSLQLNSRE
jgi:hypothetical protein